MFTNDKTIYLEMQRTGSTQIALLMSRCVGGVQIGKHNPLQDYTTDKLIVGSIRNPWDWYVSLWAYGCGGMGALYRRLTTRRPRSYVARKPQVLLRNCSNVWNELTKPVGLWRETYRDDRDPLCFRRWLRFIHDPRRKKDLGEGYAGSPISAFAGLMTYRYCRLYLRDLLAKQNVKLHNLEDLGRFDEENNILDGVIRTESLERDLVRVLGEAGHHLDQEALDMIFESRENKTNPSRHCETSFYFDDETIDLVAEREKFLIEKYCYAAP